MRALAIAAALVLTISAGAVAQEEDTDARLDAIEARLDAAENWMASWAENWGNWLDTWTGFIGSEPDNPLDPDVDSDEEDE